MRRSNSVLFKSLNDVQAEFDANAFRNTIKEDIRKKLLAEVPKLKDTLLTLNYKLQSEKLRGLYNKVNNPATLQKSIQYKEVLSDSSIARDSMRKKLREEASSFKRNYDNQRKEYDHLKKRVDSLEDLVVKNAIKVQNYIQLVSNIEKNYSGNLNSINQSLKTYGLPEVKIPQKYQALMNINRFAVGRSTLNYSDLIGRNISITGVNLEYNSHLYFALAGGSIDYRFRDYYINPVHIPQYLYLARIGLGRKGSDGVIFSFYKGRKQIFVNSNVTSLPTTIDITGFSIESKIKFLKTGYIITELGQTIGPDFRTDSIKTQKFNLNDKSNKGVSVTLNYFSPKTSTRIEGMYKYTGVNFQSFSVFQNNSAYTQWSIKADQSFWKKKLKISASVKSNEFTNPYIIENYKTNSVFENIQVSYKSKHFPMLTAGYVPISQLTSVNGQLMENKFQSIMAGLFHFYKIHALNASTSVTYNKYLNSSTDTAFSRFKGDNIFISQSLEVGLFTYSLSGSQTTNTDYRLGIFDAGLDYKIKKIGNIGFGAKYSRYGTDISKVGVEGRLSFNIRKLGEIGFLYDQGFIPGNGTLVRNDYMNLNYTKHIF